MYTIENPVLILTVDKLIKDSWLVIQISNAHNDRYGNAPAFVGDSIILDNQSEVTVHSILFIIKCGTEMSRENLMYDLSPLPLSPLPLPHFSLLCYNPTSVGSSDLSSKELGVTANEIQLTNL